MDMTGRKNIGIIGAGKVGTAVGVLLGRAGYTIAFVHDIDPARADEAGRTMGGVTPVLDAAAVSRDADILFITTPDRLIGKVADDIAGRGGIRAGHIVVHMSGSLTSDVLGSVRDYGAAAASLHPLQSFADFTQALKNIPGSVFCIEGDEDALPELRKMVTIFDGVEISVPKQDKALYHAGAVVASNYLVTLLWSAVMLLESVGMNDATALKALMPLVEGTLSNSKALGVPAALTGPIARGDATTIADHIAVMKEKRPDLLEFYRVMGRLTVDAARKNKSAPESLLKQIEDILG
jgi:predicted short-subunit dehydrogenase-like oxidoreductase (DUF2520 family)